MPKLQADRLMFIQTLTDVSTELGDADKIANWFGTADTDVFVASAREICAREWYLFCECLVPAEMEDYQRIPDGAYGFPEAAIDLVQLMLLRYFTREEVDSFLREEVPRYSKVSMTYLIPGKWLLSWLRAHSLTIKWRVVKMQEDKPLRTKVKLMLPQQYKIVMRKKIPQDRLVEDFMV